MKNIHILPTDKPSRLCKALGSHVLWLTKTYDGYNGAIYQHIYITSDEEIKVGDWCYAILSKQVFKNVNPNLKSEDKKKIILTTDQDLINDGVQAIDDEFLEWFVKNPSCEEVEVDKNWNYPLDKSWEYKIIIPQEEPKQETTLEEAAERLIFKTIGGNYGIMSSDEHDQTDGYFNTYKEAFLTLKLKWQEAEQYYNETFKK